MGVGSAAYTGDTDGFGTQENTKMKVNWKAEMKFGLRKPKSLSLVPGRKKGTLNWAKSLESPRDATLGRGCSAGEILSVVSPPAHSTNELIKADRDNLISSLLLPIPFPPLKEITHPSGSSLLTSWHKAQVGLSSPALKGKR